MAARRTREMSVPSGLHHHPGMNGSVVNTSGDVNGSLNSQRTVVNSDEEMPLVKGGYLVSNQNSISQMALPMTEHKEETQEITTRAKINISDKENNVSIGEPVMLLTTEAQQKEIDEEYDYSDDFEEDDEDEYDNSGEESDVEDNAELYPSLRLRRQSNPQLPETVTTLETDHGSKVYVVGTAHFSLESQQDVAQVISATQPDVVMVELCNSRVNILQLDEDTLLEEARNINMDKIKTAIKQSGLVQGIMHLLLLSMSAHLTKQLGMAPGGEFRRAFTEAQKIPGCRIQLGDRPIQITLRRALGSLSWWQKLRLAWYMITSKEPISKEEVEKCKQKDLLEQMLKEMTGEFPALSQVFVQERDMFLANSLRLAAHPIPHPDSPTGFVPAIVVGVVGIGHVPGIKANWDKEHNIREIMSVPEASSFSHILRWGFRASLVCILSYGCYRFIRWTADIVL